MTYGPLTLVVPEDALAEPTTIVLREAAQPPRGAVGAVYEFGPDGLEFAVPATLKVYFEPEELPAGVEPDRLRLCVHEQGRWIPLDEQVNRRVERRVVGAVRHFSVFGIVPEPRAVSLTGTRFEANGVVVETSAAVVGRLFVWPTNVSFYAQRDAVGAVVATFSGLPVDADHFAYVSSYLDERVVSPADGGTLRVDLDLSDPAVVWVQPQPGTWRIASPPLAGDECAVLGGIRAGEVCTLTADVAGSIELASGTLDCAGHRIAQPPFAVDSQQTGIGVLVGANAVSPVVRRCVLGGPGRGFAQGVYALAGGVVVEDSEFEDNLVGALLQGVVGGRLARNRFTGASFWALAVWDSSVGSAIEANEFDVDADAIAIEGPANLPAASHGHEVRGNTVTRGTGGILLAATRDNAITENDVSGVLTSFLLGPNGWPSRVWWNDFHGWSRWGVWSDVGPAELSDAGRGNWWGRTCPDALFVPSVDGNRSDVTDGFAYGTRGGWTAGVVPGCASGGGGIPICPENGNQGAAEHVWDDYVPRSPRVAAAWERLRRTILEQESAAGEEERAARAAEGITLADRPPLPPIVVWNRATDNPGLIVGRMTEPERADASAVAGRFLRDNAELFGSGRAAAGLPDLRLERVDADAAGSTFVFRQYLGAVPIEDGTSILVVDTAGVVRAYKGRYYPQPTVDLRAVCGRRAALDAALERFRSSWPTAVDVRSDAELRVVAAPDGSLTPVWRGPVEAAAEAGEERAAGFLVDGVRCTVVEFGLSDDLDSWARAMGDVQAPTGEFVRFGGPWVGDPPATVARTVRFWVNASPTRDPDLRSPAGSVAYTINDRARDADAYVRTNGLCPRDDLWAPPGSDNPYCFRYEQQERRSVIEADSCFGATWSPPNPDGARCDHWFSSYDCVTAFWRIQENMQRLFDLAVGPTGPIGVGDSFGLYCHTVESPSRYRVRQYWFRSQRTKLMLDAPGVSFEAFGDLPRYRTIDHEFGHHLTRSLMAVSSPAGDQCCYYHQGQSFSIQEVVADHYADLRSGLPAGTYHEQLNGLGGGCGSIGPDPTCGSYTSYDIERADCRNDIYVNNALSCRVADPTGGWMSCARNGYCAPIYGSGNGVCRSRCLYVANRVVNNDSFNYAQEHYPGEVDPWNPYGHGNGRVLMQALADYHERFGSEAFRHEYYGYGGADGLNRTMFTARVLRHPC